MNQMQSRTEAVTVLQEAPPAFSSQAKAISDEFVTFLETVANTPAKVRILHYFLSNHGVCLSSVQVASSLQLEEEAVCEALQQLHQDGALTYCPYFGNADLCLMNPNYHTTRMKRDLRSLQRAMENGGTEIWPLLGRA